MALTNYIPLPRISFVLACIVAALVLGACGDDDGGSDSSITPTPDASSPTDGSPTPASTEDDGNETPEPTASGVGAELKSLIDGWLDGVNAKVTYDYESNFGGHPVGTYTTYYLDGSDRHDWLNTGNELNVTLTTIVTDEASYVCNIFEANPTCETETAEQARSVRVSFLIIVRTLEAISDEVNNLAIRALPNEEIAGQDASCYEAMTTGERLTEGPPAVETVALCFSPDGMLLRVDHDAVFEDEELPDGDLLLEATEVGEPVASDFEPPARVIS